MTSVKRGWVKGEPNDYISGHHRRRPLAQRFWPRVEKTSSCWEWIGYKTKHGYGQIGVDGNRLDYAHRIAYRWLVGPIPEGCGLHHTCENPACVNPAHLEAIKQADHIRLHHPTLIKSRWS